MLVHGRSEGARKHITENLGSDRDGPSLLDLLFALLLLQALLYGDDAVCGVGVCVCVRA